jgi:hypothetical protein
MIWLTGDNLVFQLANGESVPFSPEMISVELVGDSVGKFEPDIIQHAAAAVFHHFKKDLNRETVTVGEFTVALEQALRGLGLQVVSNEPAAPTVTPHDLAQMAVESGTGGELHFYPRLRAALKTQLGTPAKQIHFRGLRPCVKRLTGARRWSPRCDYVRDQIVDFLRHCLTAESLKSDCSLVVE